MEQNVGFSDQSIRMVASALMMVIAAAFGARLAWLGILGALVLLTANFGRCPLYALIGIDTRSKSERHRHSA